jgi:SPP1 family predicted phage head-tail adaptor
MGIDAGRLRHVVDFEVREDEQDATTGGITTTWTSIEPLSVREVIAAAKDTPIVTARITVRHRAGMDAAQRIVHGTKCCVNTVGEEIFNPEGFLRDRDSGLEYVTIPCSQGANEG